MNHTKLKLQMTRNIKLLIAALLFSSTAALFAENKQQVIFSNNYDTEVTINLVWRNKSFPYNARKSEVTIKKNQQNKMIKAPVSGFKLIHVRVIPTKNANTNYRIHLAGSSMSGGGGFAAGAGISTANPALIAGGAVTAGTGIAISTLAAADGVLQNSQSIQAHNYKFFVIEKHKKHIKIKGYKSEQHYQDEVAKTQSADAAEDDNDLEETSVEDIPGEENLYPVA